MERVRINNWNQVKLRGVPLGRCYQSHHLTVGGLLAVRCEGAIVGIDTQPDEWQEKWRIDAGGIGKNYPFLIVDFKNNIYLLSTSDFGVTSYIINGTSTPTFLAKLSFGDFFIAESVILGKFYPDGEMVGVSVSSRSQHKFFGINLSEMNIDRLDESKLQAGVVFLNHDMWTHRIAGSDYDSIFLRTDFGVDCFYFDQNYNLKKRFSYNAIDKATSCESILFQDTRNSSTTRMVFTDSTALSIFEVDLNGMKSSYNEIFSGCFDNHAMTIPIGDRFAMSTVNGLDILSPVKHADKLFASENLPAEIKFAVPIAAVFDSLLIQTEKGELIQTRIEKYSGQEKSDKITYDDSVPFNEKLQPNFPLVSIKKAAKHPLLIEPPHLPWSGTSELDSHLLKEAVNDATGNLDFKIKLLDAPVIMGNTLQTILYYSSDAKISKLCGLGWDMHLPQNAIRVDREDTIFDEKFTYFIDSSNGKTSFHNNEGIFETDTNMNITITYDKDNEIWIVDTPDRTLEYGGTNAVQWSLGWPDWTGAGMDTSAMLRIPLTWYLTKSTEKIYGRNFIYKYHQTNKNVTGTPLSYTYSTNLEYIEAVQSFTITIEYGEKEESEYTNFIIPSKEPFILPTYFENNIFVKRFAFKSHTFQQIFEFSYERKEKHRLLTQISQNLSEKVEKLMALTYNDKYDVINTITTKSGATYEYQYKQSLLPELWPAKIYEYKLKKIIASAFVAKYRVFVTYDNTISKVCVDLIQNSVGVRLACFEYDSKVKADIKLDNEMFIVVFQGNVDVTISFFNFDESSGWKVNETEKMHFSNQDTHVRFLNHGVIVAQNRKVTLKHWNGKSCIWKFQNFMLDSDFDIMAISNDLIAIVSKDRTLKIFYQQNSSWKLGSNKKLDRGITSADHQDLLKMFNHGQQNEKKLLDALSRNAIQILSNVLQISFLYIEDNHIKCWLHYYHIKASYELIYKNRKLLADEDILDLKDRIKQEKEKDGFHVLKHVLIDQKYQLQVVDIDSDAYKYAANQKRPLVELNKAYKEYFQERGNLINWRKLFVQLTSKGVFGDDTFFYATGTTFTKGNGILHSKGHLGPHITIQGVKDDQNKVEIVSDGTVKYQFSGADKFVNVYPRYLAFQNQNATTVFPINGRGFIEDPILLDNVQLIDGNHTHLSTLAKHETFAFDFKYMEIPLFSVIKNTLKVTVARQQVSLIDGKRITNYQRFSKSWNQIDVTKFWDDSPKSSGTEKITLTASDNFKPSLSRDYFDCDGTVETVLKDAIVQKDSQSEPDDSSTDELRSQMIFDKTGNKIITRFAPYSTAEDEASYFGFENYEERGKWNFESDDVISNGCFTGKKCLKLNYGRVLSAEFNPRHQKGVYIASSWMKKLENVSILDPLTELKALVIIGELQLTLHGSVQKKVHGWSYSEIYLNFEVLRQLYVDFRLSDGVQSHPPVDQVKAIFKILLTPSQNQQFLIIDHVTFSPVDLDFEASVFDEVSGVLSSTIKRNGEIEHVVINKFNDQIAAYNENFELNWFASQHLTNSDQNSKSTHIEVTFESGSFVDLSIQDFSIDFSEQFYVSDENQLVHDSKNVGTIFFPEQNEMNSSGFRIQFYLKKQGEIILHFFSNRLRIFLVSINLAHIELNGILKTSTLPFGELIFLKEGKRCIVFIDGRNIFDQIILNVQGTNKVLLSMRGLVQLSNIIKFHQIGVNIEFMNEISEKRQVSRLISETTVLTIANIFDNKGRLAITTKPTEMTFTESNKLLIYRPDFVEGQDHVWTTGKLGGMVARENKDDMGYPYSRTSFKCSPLNIEAGIGQPGKNYSINGNFHKEKNFIVNLPILENMFPKDEGFHYEITKMPNESILVYVYDSKQNKVAKYINVAGFDSRLSTYHYDGENNLVKVLSPNYYRHKTLDTDYVDEKFNDGIKFEYDKTGLILKKISPDTGSIEFLYDKTNQKAYEKIYDLKRESTTVLYYKYDGTGNLMETGQLIGTEFQNKSQNQLENNRRIVFQKFYLNDEDNLATERNRRKTVKTVFDWKKDHSLSPEIDHSSTYQGNVIEKFSFNRKGDIISKQLLVADNDPKTFHRYVIRKILTGNNENTHILSYPLTGEKYFNLYHKYDKMNNLIGLGSKLNPFEYFRFDYNSLGNLVNEHHLKLGGNNLKRTYSYNSPGYLVKISDEFLDLSLEYERHGFGQDGFGDGIVMEARSIHKWQAKCNPNWLTLNDLDKQNITPTCVKALQNIGLLSASSKILRNFSKDDELILPTTCKGSKQLLIQQIICSKVKPEQQSYKYRYGDHQELISAKYISKETKIESPLTLAKLQGTTSSTSRSLWESLIKEKYIVTDNKHKDTSKAPAQVFGEFSALPDLPDNIRFKSGIKTLLEDAYFRNKTVSSENLKNMFFIWSGCREIQCSSLFKSKLDSEATNAYNILDSNDVIINRSVSSKILDVRFKSSILAAVANLFETSKMLYEHREYGILSHPYDFEAFDSDANGNHKKFYNGFKRYTLIYKDGTNKIEQVTISDLTISGIPEVSYAINHDERGNVVKAMHKNITRMHYHPVSQRTTQIDLLNGHYLRFVYDAAGERALKLVYNNQNKLLSHTFYIRDEKARVLVDVKTVFTYNPYVTKRTETLYIYGPRGLVGMIRDGAFHSIITDHAGSVRLVIKEGQVVAMFDYFPYGELQRSQNSDCRMDYLYAGKEFDEETGLYNFHARLYDPSIGRFYQADPQAQYFNPYLFAGNSPVSLVDPDGEFVIMLICAIGAAIVGAYLGGAAISDEWNPVKWNWKSGELWGGIVTGAIAGAMVPLTGPTAFAGLAVTSKVALVLFSVGMAYVSTAAATNNWDPSKWDWSSPATINGLLTGFTAGLSLTSGVKVLHIKGAPFIASLFSSQKYAAHVFIGISYTFGVAVAYGSVAGAQKEGAFWKWDFTSPAVIYGIINGFDSGLGLPQNGFESLRGMTKFAKNISKFVGVSRNIKSLIKNAKGFVKLSSSPLFKTVTSIAMGALMVSSANGFYQDGWHNEFATYESLLNGMFFGKDMKNLSITLKKITANTKLKKLTQQNERNFASKNYELSGEDFKAALANYMKDAGEIETGARKKLLQEMADDFSNGKTKMTDVIAILKQNGLGKLFTDKFIALDADIDSSNARRKQFFPEQELSFMQCGGRRRRSLGEHNVSFNDGNYHNRSLNSYSSLSYGENINSFKAHSTNRVVQEVWCRYNDAGDSYWCFHDKLHIFVSPMRGDCSLGSHTATPPLLGDSFSKCHVINDGVYCQGERSSILVTQIPQVNALDVLTAQAMLLRVAVHAASTMWKTLRSLFTTALAKERFILSDAVLCRWNQSLHALEQIQVNSGEKWARVEIEECRQVINEIGTFSSQEDVDLLEERLEALAIDLSECLDENIAHSKAHYYSTPENHIGYNINNTSMQKIMNNTSKQLLN